MQHIYCPDMDGADRFKFRFRLVYFARRGPFYDEPSTSKLDKRALYAQVELKSAHPGRLPSLQLFKP